MGLDIYFHKVQTRVNSKNESETENVEELAYFRKVNFLVAFFEDLYDNYDPAEQNCHDFKITKQDIEYLISCCKEVLEDHSQASLILPTESGYFFGDTEYDEYYFDNVQDVLEACEEQILPEFDNLDEGSEFISFHIWF